MRWLLIFYGRLSKYIEYKFVMLVFTLIFELLVSLHVYACSSGYTNFPTYSKNAFSNTNGLSTYCLNTSFYHFKIKLISSLFGSVVSVSTFLAIS